jgi:hypothetical protein
MAIPAQAVVKRKWFTLPDGLFGGPGGIYAQFAADPTQLSPVARLRPSGRQAPFQASTGPNFMAATIELGGLAPGVYAVDVVEHLGVGVETVVATAEIFVSQPEYVVWTLDFEGDAAPAETMANAAAIADGLKIPMTVMWNPRVWTTGDVSAFSADAMLAWTKGRAAKGDEIALHLHAWTDFVRAAGVAPRTAPNWAGRSDGYDVPLTAFDETETRKLLDLALRLMNDHGMTKPTSFRGGGLFANAANLRAVAAAGFTADTSASSAGTFGRLPLPWTLVKDAQPYRPSATDANAAGDLPILEVPNIAGNTYGYTSFSIQRVVNDDLAMLARSGEVAMARRALTLVSHPGTIDETERAAIETLFKAFFPLRYDADTGPLRFVTLAQLAQAFK